VANGTSPLSQFPFRKGEGERKKHFPRLLSLSPPLLQERGNRSGKSPLAKCRVRCSPNVETPKNDRVSILQEPHCRYIIEFCVL
jgi:hypothetical protein